MKTTAFLIRVTICLVLSLIPMTELENRIYSARMGLRGQRGIAEVVLVEGPLSGGDIRAFLSEFKPKLVLDVLAQQWNHLITDSDGTVRRATLSGKHQVSLAYLAYERLNSQSKRLSIKDPHLINYLGPQGSVPLCRYEEISKRKCPFSLEGKIVLLVEGSGNTYPGFYTPVGEMSFAEVLANDVQTVVTKQLIYEVPILARIPFILTTVVVEALTIIYYPVVTSAAAIVLLGACIVGFFFQFIFHFFGIYAPSANILSALLVTYLVFTGYRLAIQENLQWRSLKQAQYLRDLDRMKTNFLSLVSHDLKTPLAKIQAMVERLRREVLLPEDERSDWKELIDSIENSNNEMKHFITSILNLSKIESQKVILNKKSHDINLLIQQALKRLRPLAQTRNITIEESLEPLFSIECDEDLMRQVLTNLIDNAIKYSPNDSRIIVRSLEEEGFVRVEVEDFGPGIPKDQLPLMFRKFSRLLRPIKEPVKGSGLGLYLSRYFIELHGGTIRVQSVEGKGTTFSFTLPLSNSESGALLG